MTQATQETLNEYDPSKLEAYLKLNPDTKNSVLYSLCGATTDSEKGYIRKKKSRLLEGLESSESSNNGTDSKPNIRPSEKKVLNISQKKSESHALELILKYPELPLFMYSKLYERIKKEHLLIGNLSLKEMEDLGLDYDTEFEKLNYSFYDLYMELFEDINKGKYNQEIEHYVGDILQAYGDTFCYGFYGLPFNKDKLEEVSYWNEEEAKEWLEEQLTINNPKWAKEYDWPEEKLHKVNEHDKNHAKDMVKEGSYVEDYSNAVKEVSNIIADTIDLISKMLGFYEPLTNDMVRIIPLVFLMFDYRSFNIFDDRPNEYIRADILKLYIEMRRKKVPLDYIPCAIDYQDSIDNVYDMYREYDYRWFGMNDPEKFLQYTSDPTKEEQ